jgi:large subunit ribosomal protein L13
MTATRDSTPSAMLPVRQVLFLVPLFLVPCSRVAYTVQGMNRMKTFSLSAKEINKAWHVVDATDQTLGRLSTQVARLLMGKHKPTFSPHLDMGDFVIIVNAERIRVTGKKLDDKIYYRHTGYIGGLKETPLGDMLQRNPRRVIELSVRGMLPRNRLSRHLLGHLKVYAGPDHPHEAQVNESKKKEDRRNRGLEATTVHRARRRPRPKAAAEKAAPARPTTRKRATTAKPKARTPRERKA